MPGLSGAANHRGARGWEWGEGPGAAGAAGRRQMDGAEAETRGLPGSVSKAFCSLLMGLVTITAAAGPLSVAGKGIGEASFKTDVPIQQQPMPGHLAASGPPLSQSP